MKRTINAFYRYAPLVILQSQEQELYIDPDPSLKCRKEVQAYRIDIEDIACISRGCIIPDVKPDKQTFEVTGTGGLPVYAVGHANDAIFVHSSNFDQQVSSGGFYFRLDLIQIKRCRSEDLESVEVRINGMKAASFSSADDSWINGVDSNTVCSGHQFSLTYDAIGCDTRDDEEWGWDDDTPWRWYEIAILDSRKHHPMALDSEQQSKHLNPRGEMVDEHSDIDFPSIFFQQSVKKGHILHDIVCAGLGT